MTVPRGTAILDEMTAPRQHEERRYEIVLCGELGDRFRSAFDGVELRRVGGDTVLIAVLDQSGLHALLERIQELGLSLLSVNHAELAGPAQRLFP